MLQSKKIVPVIAVLTLLACLFTGVFMLCPQVLHITPSYSQPDYEALFDPLSVMTVDMLISLPAAAMVRTAPMGAQPAAVCLRS